MRRHLWYPLFVVAGAAVAIVASTFVASRRRNRRVESTRRRDVTAAPPRPRRVPDSGQRYGWPHTRREDGWVAEAPQQDAWLIEAAPQEPDTVETEPQVEAVQPVAAAPPAETAPVEAAPQPEAVTVQPPDPTPPVDQAAPPAATVAPQVGPAPPADEPAEAAPQSEKPAGVRPTARSRRSGNLKTTKRVLTLMLLAGIAVYVGGGGVFGSFNAETTNAGSSAASGTLTMSDAVNSGTACASVDGTSNVNSGCDAVLTLTNLAPGVFPSTGTATVTVANTGSIDASKLWLWAPPNSTTLSAGITASSTITSISVASIPTAISAGQSIVISNGTNAESLVASGSAATCSSSCSIPVNSYTTTYAYSSSNSVNVVDCVDSKTTTSPVSGATVGTDLSFNATSGNPFCGAALLYVQETTGTTSGSPGGHSYCWLGKDYGDSSGMCVAPISVNPSSTLSTGGAITSLPVTELDGNVRSGDSITITSGTNTQTFTASGNAYYGATSIPISSATPNFAYPTSSTISDTTTLGTLNSDTTDTITNFDTLHNGSQGPIELKTVTSNGTLQASGPTTELGTGSANERTFVVGVYFPQPAGNNQNALQGLSSSFGMTWHVDQ